VNVQVKPGVFVASELPAGWDAAVLGELSQRQRTGDDEAAKALTALRCRGISAGMLFKANAVTDEAPMCLLSFILSRASSTCSSMQQRVCQARPMQHENLLLQRPTISCAVLNIMQRLPQRCNADNVRAMARDMPQT